MTLIKEAIHMSAEQKIGGIFHLAATLEDILFEEKQFPVHEILKQIAEYRYQGINLKPIISIKYLKYIN